MFGSLYNDVFDIIKQWKPREDYSDENLYRDDLMTFIRKKLKKPSLMGNQQNIKIKKESGRTFADIAINESIGIELKKDLRKLSQVDRFVGQLRRYKKEYDDIIVVIVGESSDEALDELRESVNESSQSSFGLQQKRIEVIDKGEEEFSDDEESIAGIPKFRLGF